MNSANFYMTMTTTTTTSGIFREEFVVGQK